MYKAEDYTYRVSWSRDDGEYLGTVAEFPLLSYLDRDRVKALEGITSVVAAALELYDEDERQTPTPLGYANFSGKISLRMPPELHRVIAIEAAEQHVSINRLINAKLTV